MAQYQPVSWIFWVRMAQLVLAILIMALAAFAASQSWIAYGVQFSIWATVWTIIYVPIATWSIPRWTATSRPLLTALICDVLSVVWWMISFALLVDWSVSATFVGYKRMTKRDHYSDLPHCYSNYDQAKCTKEINAAHERWKAAAASTKASTAFAAVNFILFMVTLHMICVQFRQSRKQQITHKA